MAEYTPHVDDYRIEKALDGLGKHWIWRFEIDGRWEFVAAKDEMEAEVFVEQKDWLAEDEKYEYWH